jgi:hypothetical protein
MKLFTTIVAALAVFAACVPCQAETKDPEAAARQARIDAGEADAKIKELREDQKVSVDVDAPDSLQGLADQDQINQEERKLENAERREAEVEGAASDNE